MPSVRRAGPCGRPLPVSFIHRQEAATQPCRQTEPGIRRHSTAPQQPRRPLAGQPPRSGRTGPAWAARCSPCGSATAVPLGSARACVPCARRARPDAPCASPRRDAALTETQVPPVLRTVVLDSAARPLVETQLRHRNLHLQGHELHGLARQLRSAAGKPAVLRIELQEDGEAQPRRTALAGHKHLLVLQQRPVLDQLIQFQRGTGHSRRSPLRGLTHRSRTASGSPARGRPALGHSGTPLALSR